MCYSDYRAERKPIVFFVALLWLILGGSVLAQEKEQKVPQQKAAYNVTVNAITIAVTVQDRKGRYVNDLGEKDFIVYENGERRTINYFQHDQSAPLSLTVLLDVSGSMALEDKFEDCRRALHVLAEKILAPQDELALLVFADGEVEVAARHSQDRSTFLAELDGEKAYGKTALHDAVAVSPQYAVRARNEKRALILITDGIENDSQSSAEQALEIARRVDVPIYVIGYKIPRAEEILARHKRRSGLTAMGIVETLNLFAEATGGKAFFLDDLEGLLSTLYEIKKEQSHQYIIGYTSYKEDDKYRRIMVTTPGGNYRIRTRQGY
ncbi:MAG: VWA domain-containing protein [Candidatus Aminicenantes bacterium]|nr:VWA domain-containing protein [Candidatus Aminicenantes bacterium]